MKHHIAVKCAAFLLAMVCLLGALFSGVGIGVLINMDLYDDTLDEAYAIQMWAQRRELASDLTYAYATLKLGEIPEEYFRQYYGYEWMTENFQEGYYFYSIFDTEGVVVESTVEDDLEDALFYEIALSDIAYRRLVTEENPADPTKDVDSDEYYDAEEGSYIKISYQVNTLSGYIVHLYLLPGAYKYDPTWQLVQLLYTVRYDMFWILGVGLVVFLLAMIYLCCAAGRKPGTDTLYPGGLNRMPLDLYTAVCGGGLVLLVLLGNYLLAEMLYGTPQLFLHLMMLVGLAACLLVVGLIVAWAAQLKMPKYFWLKNTLVGRILILLGKGLGYLYRICRALVRMLPVMWQWVVTAMLMGTVPFALFMVYLRGHNVFVLVLFILAILGDIALSLYGSYCFGTLMKGAQQMSEGNLLDKVEDKILWGCFRDFAGCLNTLSDAAYNAAEKQMRSERMKTELITNVSHDIKTPLTSIINFVDLLQKPHTPQQEAEYLEVLSRQSGQMKKLIEDLMELSKANSGNLTVNLGTVDAEEAVNQALGEFSDKLDAVELVPVFKHPEEPVYMTADGHHLWRVLFNLLTNAVKYALPGTRLYIDLVQEEDKVLLSIKNVSREELNISADELMERFVRGDSARKSEGSGLGLNIAKSLMEVQGSQLELLLDGDLFKVTLIFPAVQE